MKRLAAGALLALLSWLPAAHGQPAYTDRFLVKNSIGTLGLLLGSYEKPANAKRVLVLGSSPVEATRQKYCHIAIAHLDASRVGEETFAAVQLIKFFTRHGSPALIHVARNAGWTSLPGHKVLAEMPPKQVGRLSFEEFAAFHRDSGTIKMRPLLLNKHVEWHAAASGTEESYSASEEHAGFWGENPLDDADLKNVRSSLAASADKVRIENRLVRFRLTDSPGSRKIPSVTFDCNDPSLVLVAARVYRPFSIDSRGWGFLHFR